MWLKRIFWYNMLDLEVRGKDKKLAKKGTSTVLAVTFLLFVIDYCLWNIAFVTDSLSNGAFETMSLFGAELIGKVAGLLSFALLYLLILVLTGRENFFEQTLLEYDAMSYIQKEAEARKGKYLIVISFVPALVLLFYIIFFRLD